jgi:methylmalonyl-CoA/ethylmalonyl-CoA epimerase
MSSVNEDLKLVPGIKFVDHVAIAVKQGELDRQVEAYEMLGFHEVHREEVLGVDQVREALLRIGDGPNLIQLLEPDREKRRTRRAGPSRFSRGERAAGL